MLYDDGIVLETIDDKDIEWVESQFLPRLIKTDGTYEDY